jgi:phenylalanyl-tRNA synthetase beta chain
MKVSFNWLRDFVDIPRDTDSGAFARLFTLRTAEVEGVEDQSEAFADIVVGQIQEIHPHPNADKLKITKTSVGKETLQIICAAANIREGMYVAIALPGAKIRWHGEGDLLTLEPAKIRGEESFGMICAGDEIGLEATPEGILDISPLKPAIGMPLSELLEKNDVILHIDNKSLTHRPDLWGHYGIAREVAAITGKPLKPLTPQVAYPTEGQKISVSVKDKKLCPRYIGVAIEGIKIEPSPEWMQKRLISAGYRPINNVVDVTNYVMAETGQPMHAFDAAKIETGIVVRTAKPNEGIVTLDGVIRKLTTEMLVIADHKKAVAVAGVMGGANSEVDSQTTKIILEAANFNPASVRKTAAKLQNRTEAVQRFEKSLDPNLADLAMDRAVELILQICPQARITAPKNDIKNFKDPKTVITIDLNRLSSKIGKEIESKQVLEILGKLQFPVAKVSKGKIKVQIPSFRPMKDISIEDDLVEEIARMYGYENIEPVIPELPVHLPIENKERKLKHYARQVMSLGLGFNEVYNYSFYGMDEIRNCLLPEELHEKIDNYLSADQTHLRVSLVPNMLKNVATNLKNFDRFGIYEIGRTYEDLQEYFPLEKKKICAMLVSPANKCESSFYDAKGALEAFLRAMHAPALELTKGESLCPYAHPNKYASYRVKETGEEIARVFEIHPKVLMNHKLEKVSIGAFEVNFNELAALIQPDTKYKPIPRFPGIEIDVSVLMNKNTEIAKITKLISQADPTLIKEVKLFDSYEGANIPETKKSLSFKITLRADDRTLIDEDMQRTRLEVFKHLTHAGGEIRGI